MRQKLRYCATAVAGLLLIIGVSGCQYNYPFEISGVVRNAADGAPLAGVSVTIRADGIRGESPFPVITGPDGTFKARFEVGDIEFMRDELPQWSLTLSKDGYQDATLDISPKQEPESPRKTTQLRAQGHLVPK